MTTLPELEPAGMEAARRKGRELAGNQPGALIEAFAEVAAAGAVAYLSAARSAPEAGKAVVKPLEWEKYPPEGSMSEGQNEQRQYVARALTPWAAIFLMEKAGAFSLAGGTAVGLGSFDSAEVAKAAAHADFEQRILSCLASVSALSGADSEAVPAEDVAGLVERLNERASSYRLGGPSSEHTASLLDEAAAALTASEAEATSLRRKLEEATEPNLFWDDENPEESFTSIEDLADYIGERAIMLKVRTARSLPDEWVSAVAGEDDGWTVKYHASKDDAQAEFDRARTLGASE